MRSVLLIACAATAATAQGSISGEVVVAGQPLPYATVAVVSQGRQLLTNERGWFRITNLPAREVRLRFKRIGFVPKDTTLTVADSARIRIEMTRLVIQLPEMVVSGKCTNETPGEPVPGFLAQLIDQVVQNSERMALLTAQKPFQMRIEAVEGLADWSNVIKPIRVDTAVRSPFAEYPYKPRKVMFQLTKGPHKGAWGIVLPELSDIADTAFTNNHCFRYAGRAVVGGDSVIQVEFEPVPWLDREYDLNGTLYLRVDDYQIVGSFTRLNHLSPQATRAGLAEYFVEARFKEIVPGVPILDWMQLTNRWKTNKPGVSVRSRVIGIDWK